MREDKPGGFQTGGFPTFFGGEGRYSRDSSRQNPVHDCRVFASECAIRSALRNRAAVRSALSGQAIRTPMFRRFARIDSRIETYFEALGQIRANRGQTSLLSIFWKVDSQKKGLNFPKRGSIR